MSRGVRVIGTVEQLRDLLRQEVVDELILAMPLKKIENADKHISLAEDMGIKVRIMPDWQLHYLMYKPKIAMIRFEQFLQVPTMALHTTSSNEGALFFKTVADFVLAGMACLVLLPVFGLIALGVKLSSKGPVFYAQERLGLYGRRFRLYKFRTMVQNADQLLQELKSKNEVDGPVFKIKKDPRIVPLVGTFLRKTSLDELPQLFNVLRGEMSIVGPRPPIPDEVDEYDIWQRRRLSMKPGLTCLWQIAPSRNDLSFEEWMHLDLKYIDNWSLGLDLKLIFSTALVMLTGNGR